MRDERSKGWDNRLNGSLLYCIGAGNELNSSDARGLQQNDPFLMLPFWKVLSSHTLRCRRRSQSIGRLSEPKFDLRRIDPQVVAIVCGHMRSIPATLLFTGTGQREEPSATARTPPKSLGACAKREQNASRTEKSIAFGYQHNFWASDFPRRCVAASLRWCAASAQESTASFKTPTECGIISSAPLSRVGKPPGTPSFTHAEAVWCVKSYVTVVIYLCRLASIFLTFTSPHWFFFAEFCSYIVYTPTLQCNRK